MDSDIVEFLRARLDEDEAVAQAANVKQEDPRWWASKHIDGATVRSERDNRPMARVEYLPSDEDDSPGSTSILDPHEVAGHIARHDPARVLRECEAKRRIVDLAWHHLGDEEYGWGMEEAKRQVLRVMASVYADHPDYRDEWAA